MQFIGRSGHFDDSQIRFVTLEELVEIAMSNMKNGTEAKLKMHQVMKVYFEEKEICWKKLEEDHLRDTGGSLLF